MPDPDPNWYWPMRRGGEEILKQRMWNNLGVDYQPGSQHMDDTQTWNDRSRSVNKGGHPDILDLQGQEKVMEKNLMQPGIHISPDIYPQPISAMSSALQGPQDPAMQALFAQPAPHLQHMAGNVIDPGPMKFLGNDPGAGSRYDQALQAPSGAAAVRAMGGLAARPPNVLPLSPQVLDYMRGKLGR